jgi:hypothetical protein
VQCIGNWTRALLADLQALARGKRLHFSLDLVELAEVLKRILRNLALVRCVQIVEFAPCVCHATEL